MNKMKMLLYCGLYTLFLFDQFFVMSWIGLVTLNDMKAKQEALVKEREKQLAKKEQSKELQLWVITFSQSYTPALMFVVRGHDSGVGMWCFSQLTMQYNSWYWFHNFSHCFEI